MRCSNTETEHLIHQLAIYIHKYVPYVFLSPTVPYAKDWLCSRIRTRLFLWLLCISILDYATQSDVCTVSVFLISALRYQPCLSTYYNLAVAWAAFSKQCSLCLFQWQIKVFLSWIFYYLVDKYIPVSFIVLQNWFGLCIFAGTGNGGGAYINCMLAQDNEELLIIYYPTYGIFSFISNITWFQCIHCACKMESFFIQLNVYGKSFFHIGHATAGENYYYMWLKHRLCLSCIQQQMCIVRHLWWIKRMQALYTWHL